MPANRIEPVTPADYGRITDVWEAAVRATHQQFYLRMGFRVHGRSPLDSLGKPFPLLHMSYAPELPA